MFTNIQSMVFGHKYRIMTVCAYSLKCERYAYFVWNKSHSSKSNYFA